MVFVSLVSFVVILESLRAFFECGGLTAEMRENFAREMEGSGDQNWWGLQLSLCERVINRRRDGEFWVSLLSP